MTACDPLLTAGSRLCKWPTGQDLDLDYNFRLGHMDRDGSFEFQLNANYVANSIILDSGQCHQLSEGETESYRAFHNE